MKRQLFTALALASLPALAPIPSDPLEYPLAMHTRWTYHMRQEFAPGVHPAPADRALLTKDNVIDTTVVSEVVGSDTIGGVTYSRVESRHDGRLWMTEWMRLTVDGLFLGKTNEDGDPTLFTPPQKILSPRLAPGESWAWKAAGAPVSIRVHVVGRDNTDVPAGTFDAVKTIHDLTMTLPQATVHSVNSRWFASGVGYVRQESETSAGGRQVSRTQLELTAFSGAKPTTTAASTTVMSAAAAPSAATAQAATQPAPQSAEQESEMGGVTTRIAYLRQGNGALHLGVVFKNTTDKPVRGPGLLFDGVTLTEPKSRQKHFPLKGAEGHFIAGPISDWNSGGRWWVNIPAHREVLVWALFDAIGGDTVDVSLPVSQPFDAVRVTTDPPAALEAAGLGLPVRGTITSATRADGQLKVRITIASTGAATDVAALYYSDVYVLDPANKRQYPLIKDSDGNFLGQPVTDHDKGGRLFLKVPARGQVFMALTFTAPPDSVKLVDIVVPQLDLFEAVPIAGDGGSGAAGAAVAGRTIGLEKALEDLHADVTPQQVKVNLSADVLFDFDKADLKPEAEPQLAELATVVKSYPGASVAIEGHSDGKGADGYNQTLSERRAASVAQWLIAKGGASASQLHTRGWGKAKPIAPNTKPNGADDPDGRAKNRRVEITITKP